MSLIKKILSNIKRKRLEKYKRMNSEILCAIAHQVYKEQTEAGVNLPAFQLVSQRYNKLGISTPKDLIRVYTQFFLDGQVTGIEL